jgi:hypothetical protein
VMGFKPLKREWKGLRKCTLQSSNDAGHHVMFDSVNILYEHMI